MTAETEADIVHNLRAGMHVWFADKSGEGFREVARVEPWTAAHNTWNRDLADEWVTVTYTDGYVRDAPRDGTWEIWKSGPRPMVSAS